MDEKIPRLSVRFSKMFKGTFQAFVPRFSPANQLRQISHLAAIDSVFIKRVKNLHAGLYLKIAYSLPVIYHKEHLSKKTGWLLFIYTRRFDAAGKWIPDFETSIVSQITNQQHRESRARGNFADSNHMGFFFREKSKCK